MGFNLKRIQSYRSCEDIKPCREILFAHLNLRSFDKKGRREL